MKNEKQQTVLQFYDEQYCMLELQFEKHEITFDEFQVKRNQLYNKAIEMEKERTIDMIVQFSINNFDVHRESAILNVINKAEKYYDKTQRGNK